MTVKITIITQTASTRYRQLYLNIEHYCIAVGDRKILGMRAPAHI